MSFDFTYGNSTINSSGGFIPTKKNAPTNPREVVDTYADIATIPNPYVGLKITVKVDETNNNKMTDYIVKSLKANSIGLANSLIDEVVRYVDYLGVNTSGGGTGLTTEQANNIAKIPAIKSTVDALPNNYASKNHNHSEYASSSHRHNASEIDNLPSGEGTGGLTEEQKQQLSESYANTHTHENKALLDSITVQNVYLTQEEYNLLTTEEKNDSTKVYNITNADITTGYMLSLDGYNLRLQKSTGEIISTISLESFASGGGGEVYGALIVTPTSLLVNPSSSITFNVKLSSAPTKSQTVSITTNDSNISLSSSTLTFTSANYDREQTVTVTTNSSFIGGTSISLSSTNTTANITLSKATGESGGAGGDVEQPTPTGGGIVSLLDSSKIETKSYLDSNGQVVTQSANQCVINDFIAISTDHTYIATTLDATTTTLFTICEYDSIKDHIKRFKDTKPTIGMIYNPSSTASYVKFGTSLPDITNCIFYDTTSCNNYLTSNPTFVSGYLSSTDGSIVSSAADLTINEYIAVDNSKQLNISTYNDLIFTTLYVAEYDSNKTFITRNKHTSLSTVSISLNSSTAYVRIACTKVGAYLLQVTNE